MINTNITQRAKAYLATLQRKPFMPTSDVERIIRGQGFPCFSAWLDFHERYAGYLDIFGRDSALWGLVHEEAVWLAPSKADIDRELCEETWYVTCADVHPSYSYRLDNKGEFIGTPAESFDIHVERIALGWQFALAGHSRRLAPSELRAPKFKDFVATQLRSAHVAEASDRYRNYYMTDRYFVVEDATKRTLQEARAR